MGRRSDVSSTRGFGGQLLGEVYYLTGRRHQGQGGGVEKERASLSGGLFTSSKQGYQAVHRVDVKHAIVTRTRHGLSQSQAPLSHALLSSRHHRAAAGRHSQ